MPARVQMVISTDLMIERARLDGVLTALCEIGGFPLTVAAVQSALQRLAAEQRETGSLPTGWVA